MLRIKKLDEVWAFVECEPGQCQEISDLLTFEVPGAKFMPSYRKKYWDGKIRLYDAKKSRIYTGLHTKMRDFALANNSLSICKRPGAPGQTRDSNPQTGVGVERIQSFRVYLNIFC